MKPKIDFKQSADGQTLELYIYDAVMPDGYDWWSGVEIVSETSADYFRKQLSAHPNVTQINLYINSPGGSVMEGYGIYAQLKRHPACVTAYIDGFACSVASLIAMAADKIVMYANSMMMIHNASDIVYGDARALRKAADDLDKIMEGDRQAYLVKSGAKLTEQKLMEMLDAETWLTASDCMAFGLCDEIADREINQAAANGVMQRANMSIKAQLSARQALRKLLQDADPRELEPTPPSPPPSKPKPDPTPQQGENKARRMFAALFREKGE